MHGSLTVGTASQPNHAMDGQSQCPEHAMVLVQLWRSASSSSLLNGIETGETGTRCYLAKLVDHLEYWY